MNFIACTSAACDDGFLFAVGPPASLFFGTVFNSGEAFGDAQEVFNPAAYSLVALATVPGPATLLLLASAITGLGAVRAWRRP